MKTLKRVILSVLLISILFSLIDFYIFRGHFSSKITYSFFSKRHLLKEVESINLEFNIKKVKDSYKFSFKNKTFKPFFVWTYRSSLVFKMNDSTFFSHLRLKTNFPKYKNDYHYGLDCGTGAGIFSINPFESFQVKLNYKKLINIPNWSSHHYNNKKGDTIMDLIYNKPLLLVHRDREVKKFKRSDLSSKDSVNINFYLPAFNYNHQKLIYIKSNEIKICYLDIIKNLIESKKLTFKKPVN